MQGINIRFYTGAEEDVEEMVELFSRGEMKKEDVPNDVTWEWSLSDIDWLQYIEGANQAYQRTVVVKHSKSCSFVICPKCGSSILTNTPCLWFAIACSHCACVSYATIDQVLEPSQSSFFFQKSIQQPPLKKRKLNPSASEFAKRLANRCFILLGMIKQNFYGYESQYRDFLSKISHLMKMEGVWCEIFIKGTEHRTVLNYLIELYYKADYIEHNDPRNNLFRFCIHEGIKTIRHKNFKEYLMNIDSSHIELRPEKFK